MQPVGVRAEVQGKERGGLGLDEGGSRAAMGLGRLEALGGAGCILPLPTLPR